MFTGLVEEIGSIQSIHRSAQSLRLAIRGSRIFSDISLGASIAVNGVCLTVTSFTGEQFTADVMPESVKMTTLPHLQVGDKVNLERAMASNGRFGGHIVAGHVDGTGRITQIQKFDNSVVFRITTEPHIMHYIIYKGSITVDGASLTVSKVGSDYFEISIIPHTLGETILGTAKVGTVVNLETDLIGRYIEHFMKPRVDGEHKKSEVTMDMLYTNGFI